MFGLWREGLLGFDEPRLLSWLLEQVPELEPPVAFELISGGRSNLTFTATDGTGCRFVLRRPPLGHVLDSAHDMAREYRVISALAPTPIPVPTPRAFCDDRGVADAPFYVMDHVEGRIVRDQASAEQDIPEPERALISDYVVDVLADLHAPDPDDLGLGGLGHRDGYVDRQLRRWYRQWTSAKRREIPAVDRVYELLCADIPRQQRVSVVHGDYRLDNLVLCPGGSIAAILDWELCTLGDPLADVGMLLVNWLQAGEDARHMLIGTPTRAAGFADRATLVRRYAERTGHDVSRIGFYTALGLWKLACIAEGMYVRYLTGAMGDGDDEAVGRLAAQVGLLAERALAVLEDEDR